VISNSLTWCRSNTNVIDDVCGSGMPKVRRGSVLHYESSVFSPPRPMTLLRRGPKLAQGSTHTELKEMIRSPRLDRSDANTEISLKRRKRVLASYDAMKQVMQKMDTSRTGEITARDLNGALDKLGIKMRKGDFNRLAADVDHTVHQSSSTHLPALGRVSEEPARRRGERLLTLGKDGSKRDGRKTQLAHPSSWRTMLESKVSRHWKQLQRDFKRFDEARTGLIDMQTLIPILEAAGIVLRTEDADALYQQMGVGLSGKIHWGEFLKCFAGAGLARPGAISAPPGMISKSGQSKYSQHLNEIPEALEGYLRSIANHWKAIRQACQVAHLSIVQGFCRLENLRWGSS